MLKRQFILGLAACLCAFPALALETPYLKKPSYPAFARPAGTDEFSLLKQQEEHSSDWQIAPRDPQINKTPGAIVLNKEDAVAPMLEVDRGEDARQSELRGELNEWVAGVTVKLGF